VPTWTHWRHRMGWIADPSEVKRARSTPGSEVARDIERATPHRVATISARPAERVTGVPLRPASVLCGCDPDLLVSREGSSKVWEVWSNPSLIRRHAIRQCNIACHGDDHVHHIISKGAAVESSEVERRVRAKLVWEHDGTEPIGDLPSVFCGVRCRSSQAADTRGELGQSWSQLVPIFCRASAVIDLTHGFIGHQHVGDQGQTPARNLDFRGVAVEGGGGPRMDAPLADHPCGDLENDGGDVPLGKKVLAVLPSLRSEPVLLGQGRSVFAESLSIAREQVRRQTCESSFCGTTTLTPELLIEEFHDHHHVDISTMFDYDSLAIMDFEKSIKYDIELLRSSPAVPKHIKLYGFFYEISSGKLIEVVRDIPA
jgi:hypothetical protein